jgi:hypothetical protein
MLVPELLGCRAGPDVLAVSVSSVGGGKRLRPKTAGCLSKLSKAEAHAPIYWPVDFLRLPNVPFQDLKVS